MRMLKSKYILFAVFLLATVGVSAQKAERDYIRKGNRLFNDSVFVDAEVNYRKALEANPKSTVSMYNLGNTLSQQQKFQDAMEQYVSASKIEKDKMKLAHIYHNMVRWLGFSTFPLCMPKSSFQSVESMNSMTVIRSFATRFFRRNFYHLPCATVSQWHCPYVFRTAQQIIYCLLNIISLCAIH